MLIDSRFLSISITLLENMNFLINLEQTAILKLIVHFVLYRVIYDSDTIHLPLRQIISVKLILGRLEIGVKLLILHLITNLFVCISLQYSVVLCFFSCFVTCPVVFFSESWFLWSLISPRSIVIFASSDASDLHDITISSWYVDVLNTSSFSLLLVSLERVSQ